VLVRTRQAPASRPLLDESFHRLVAIMGYRELTPLRIGGQSLRRLPCHYRSNGIPGPLLALTSYLGEFRVSKALPERGEGPPAIDRLKLAVVADQDYLRPRSPGRVQQGLEFPSSDHGRLIHYEHRLLVQRPEPVTEIDPLLAHKSAPDLLPLVVPTSLSQMPQPARHSSGLDARLGLQALPRGPRKRRTVHLVALVLPDLPSCGEDRGLACTREAS